MPESKSESNQQDLIENEIRWQGENEVANHLALLGFHRYITYEDHHAFILSEAAVNEDSSLFASHVLLAFLGKGDRREYHRKMASQFVQGENRTSRLFVSLLDFDDINDSLRTERKRIWTEMHEISNDPFIHYMYIRHMNGTNAEKIRELEKLIKFCTENDYNYTATAANNMMGYLHMREGNLNAGVKAIEECLKLHPGGYNPLDSRAEFYLFQGDTAEAIQTYQKVLERYPYAEYAISKLDELQRDL